jgi:hypothetical protein
MSVNRGGMRKTIKGSVNEIAVHLIKNREIRLFVMRTEKVRLFFIVRSYHMFTPFSFRNFHIRIQNRKK